jgi:hypothetical protein
VIERATQLKLAVDVGSDPITGSVAVGEGAPTSFCGWIELVAAIEAVRHGGRLTLEQPEGPTGTPVGPVVVPQAAAEDDPLTSSASPAAPAESALG